MGLGVMHMHSDKRQHGHFGSDIMSVFLRAELCVCLISVSFASKTVPGIQKASSKYFVNVSVRVHERKIAPWEFWENAMFLLEWSGQLSKGDR